MPNNVLTHQIVAREAAAVLSEVAPFLSNVNLARSDEFATSSGGYKAGQTIQIKVPPTSRVFDGATFAGGGAGDDAAEQSVSLQLLPQRHAALQFTAREKALNVTEFKERFLRPAMVSLSSVIEADFIARATRLVPNVVGTPGTVPGGLITYQQARARMQQYLAPETNRTMLFSSDANVNLTEQARAAFNPRTYSEDAVRRGSIGAAAGADFYEHQSLLSFSAGTQASFTVNGADQSGSTLNIGGLTAANTIPAGTVFTIAGVNAVHPLTGGNAGFLQQFVVTADFVAAGATGTISIFPAITAAMPNRTVTAAPANSAACSLVVTGANRRQNLMFHRDAFACAFVPLPVLASCEGYTATLPNGISVRVMTFGDGNADIERTRIDIMGGIAGVRPLHACRVTE